MTQWPEAGAALWSELAGAPGRFALLVGPEANAVASDLADLRGTMPVHVGGCLAALDSKPNEIAIRSRLAGSPVLVGMEVCFDPVLNLDPVRMLAQLARATPPVVAVWPVITDSRRLAFPPGVTLSRDTAEDLRGCLLLTTRTTIFADEVPYTAERFT